MPRVQGYLLKQDYQDGAYVTADQLLFEIDDRPYKAALDQTLGDLAQQQATLKKISSMSRNTSRSRRRARRPSRNSTTPSRRHRRARLR